jgi:hypothetical protein
MVDSGFRACEFIDSRWIDGVASFETAASRPPQDKAFFFVPSAIYPHPEERPQAASLSPE